LSKTLKAMLAESQDAMVKPDEKKRRENEASAAIYINLTKEDIEVQRLDVAAKSRAEDNRIIFADLNTMDAGQHAWFEKK
jgi:hypothetical protein